MLAMLGHFVVRRRWAVLVAAAMLLGVSGAVGGGVAANLTSGGFDDPDAEASRAAAALDEEFGVGAPNLVLLVTVPAGVDDPAAVDAGLDLTRRLSAEDNLVDVGSYWSLRAQPLASDDGTQAMVLGRVTGNEDEINQRLEHIAAEYARDGEAFSVAVGGQGEIFRQVGETVESDLLRAESIAFPITLGLLLVVFGSVVAALLPLAVGALAVLGTFLILQLLTGVTDVSVFALNLTTTLGLGPAIDYSLFVVSASARNSPRACPPLRPSSGRSAPPARPWRSVAARSPSRSPRC